MTHYTQRARKKNLDTVAKLLASNQGADRFTLQSLIAYNLGCTIKKAEEYISVIEMLSQQSTKET